MIVQWCVKGLNLASDAEAKSSIRLGFGRYTTEEELVEALTLIQDAAARQLSFAA